MKKREMLDAIHSEYNVLSAHYDGFEYSLTLAAKHTKGLFVRITGNQVTYNIIPDMKGELAADISEYDYKALDRLGKYMTKRMMNFKDPFKHVNGWA